MTEEAGFGARPRRTARLAAARAIALWYAANVALAFAIPDGIFQVVVGVLMLLVLGAYCSTRPRRGELIGSIAVAPILAAIALSDLVGIPAWTVAYPGAAVALVAIGYVDRGAGVATPAGTTRTAGS